MWCTNTKSFKDHGGVPTAPPAHFAAWNRQLAKAKMFDNLIGNLDPNLGNWLVDPAWNLILIDHTRAFTSDKNMVHKKMDRIDGELWDKMKSLTAREPHAAAVAVDRQGRDQGAAAAPRRDGGRLRQADGGQPGLRAPLVNHKDTKAGDAQSFVLG